MEKQTMQRLYYKDEFITAFIDDEDYYIVFVCPSSYHAKMINYDDGRFTPHDLLWAYSECIKTSTNELNEEEQNELLQRFKDFLIKDGANKEELEE